MPVEFGMDVDNTNGTFRTLVMSSRLVSGEENKPQFAVTIFEDVGTLWMSDVSSACLSQSSVGLLLRLLDVVVSRLW